jgi:D-alanine-D-alanine ligase
MSNLAVLPKEIALSQLQQEKVAVLYGGNSAEREVSLNSGRAVAEGLKRAGIAIELIDTKTVALAELKTKKIDRAFIALHGRGGEDGCIQGALEYLNIPYTGSNVLGSSLSMDKVRSKQIFKACGLPTAPFIVACKESYKKVHLNDMLAELGGRVMVKPANEGSSIGMAQAKTEEQLHNALLEAFSFDNQVLLEAWIDGPEYTVALLGKEALPAIHMRTPREFYDYEAKYQSKSTEYFCPSGLNEDDETTIKAIAIKAFNATGASGWGRVDFMRNQKKQWQILEVNTVPGMTETSLVPKAANEYGISFSELVTKILQLSVKK